MQTLLSDSFASDSVPVVGYVQSRSQELLEERKQMKQELVRQVCRVIRGSLARSVVMLL